LEKCDTSLNLKLAKPFIPIYHTTEKLKRLNLDYKGISKLMALALEKLQGNIDENLPTSIRNHYKLISKEEAIQKIHFPQSLEDIHQAKRRLKFEELFFLQLKIMLNKQLNQKKEKGLKFPKTQLFKTLYNEILPFELTQAQKRVIKEIYTDCNSGFQMNRLIQGDVGSGKTIVAFSAMLFAVNSGYQSCLMAPTEILAEQHFNTLQPFAQKLGITVELLTGSTTSRKRKYIYENLFNGTINILIGTHALLEETVQFKLLGLCIVDEQHRFGVAQRAKLWNKNENIFPHVLVMTATPIPRTLALTVYGDLDHSIIDELPPNRKPVITILKTDAERPWIINFIKYNLANDSQIYIVYPVIEESENSDLKDLMEGYKTIRQAFPDVPISIVHGRLKPKDKEMEMLRFLNNQTKIMIATTVIEVGVNVPNASVMIIENAERFGLSQLHQLRGRIGRGAKQSYCILVHKEKISNEAKERLLTMKRTNNGFEIAEVDLKLRGPGDILGTKQSGTLKLTIANLIEDNHILIEARKKVIEILNSDPYLERKENECIKKHIDMLYKNSAQWAKIS
jgi:ATP-dependent DNA helicase RecG